MSIFLPCSSLSSLVVVVMGVFLIFVSSNPTFLISSLVYLTWFMKIPSLYCLIWSSKKYLSSPIIIILNSSFMHDSKSLQNFSEVDPNRISSTYICTIKISLSTCFVNKVVSILPLMKLFSTRKLLNLSYQAFGACFIPYKAFSSLNTKSECVGSTNLGVAQHILPLNKTIQKFIFSIHLKKLNILEWGKSKGHPYGFESYYGCKVFLKIDAFDLGITLCH